MDISLTELEEAINYWRRQHPATGEECALSSEVNTLAGIYAMMIFEGVGSLPRRVMVMKSRGVGFLSPSTATTRSRPDCIPVKRASPSLTETEMAATIPILHMKRST